MSFAPFVPIIAEATKFLFSEAAKWMDHARQRTDRDLPAPTQSRTGERTSILTRQDFAALESNMPDLAMAINAQAAEANAYVIKGLVEQINIHQRNLTDLEKTEAEYGPLTPAHVKRGIEREAVALVEKSGRLKELLEQVHGKSIDL